MKTIVYVDGFNLYYRALRGHSGRKWLNLHLLAKAVLRPENDIVAVRYYTANVSARNDPQAPARQQVYLDALATVPSITIHKGNFLVSKKWSMIVQPPRAKVLTGTPPVASAYNFALPPPTLIEVWKTEEKGSDVNLASHLLRDAYSGLFDAAAVLTNDTDLTEPIRIVAKDLGFPVGILCPVPKPAGSLAQVASFIRRIEGRHIHASQFPDTIPGTQLTKPLGW